MRMGWRERNWVTVTPLTGSILLLFALLIGCKCASSGEPREGKFCAVEGDNVCGRDGKTRFVCRAGAWRGFACEGPEKCAEKSGVVVCDSRISVAGTTCDEPGNGACGIDLLSYVVCTNGQWIVSSACLGPSGCKSMSKNGMSSVVHCDESLARAGAACDVQGSLACSEDRSAELTCSKSVWSKTQDCPGTCLSTREGDTVTIDCR